MTRHPRGFWFFFCGEFAERCSFYGMRAILLLYMAERLGFGEKAAQKYYFLFTAACYFLPLVGGFLADFVFGKYWTIVGFSLPYILGQYFIGIEDPAYLWGSLCLLAMGSGVIKPNISTLMGMTYDQQRPGNTKLRADAFQLFYMAINIGALLSQTAMPWLRTNYGYRTAFLFPVVLMCVALVLFALGKPYYAREESVLAKAARGEADDSNDPRWKTLGWLAGVFLLVTFFWAIFDQSTGPWVLFANAYMVGPLIDVAGLQLDFTAEQMQALNPLFIVIFTPITMLVWRGFRRAGVNVRPTDKMLVGFLLTALTMGIMAAVAYITPDARPSLKVSFPNGQVVLPAAQEPLAEARLSEDRPLTAFSMTNEGVRLSIDKGQVENGKLSFTDGTIEGEGYKLVVRDGLPDLASSTGIDKSGRGAGLESKFRALDKAPDKAKVTVTTGRFVLENQRSTLWWQVVAYMVLTLAELLVSVTGLEMAFAAAPKSISGVVASGWLLTVALGNLVINVPLTEVYDVMRPGPYFGLLAVMMLGVTVALVWVGSRFNAALDAAGPVGDEKRPAPGPRPEPLMEDPIA